MSVRGNRASRYTPSNPPEQGLGRWAREELERLADTLQSPAPMLLLEVSRRPPDRLPADRVPIVFADGTDWNPGAGAGVYAYHSGTWNKLG